MEKIYQSETSEIVVTFHKGIESTYRIAQLRANITVLGGTITNIEQWSPFRIVGFDIAIRKDLSQNLIKKLKEIPEVKEISYK